MLMLYVCVMSLGPRVAEKADEKIGEEDVFADAVSEFSRSDSFKEKEETATNCIAKNPGEFTFFDKEKQFRDDVTF